MRQPRIFDYVLTADYHLREDTPSCYTGLFQEEQWYIHQFISDVAQSTPVLHAGDLFHHWKPSPWLLSMAIKYLPKNFYTVYGQHDIPQHNLELRHKSGIYTLENAGRIKVLNGAHWGQVPEDNMVIECKGRKILVWHYLTYTVKPFPGAEGGMAEGLLRKYPQFDLIVTGDNHVSFTVEYEGRRLVNPGNVVRQTAAQIDFKPSIWLWSAETNNVSQIYLPMRQGVITRDHIIVKEQRNKRLEAFIERLDSDWDANLSFKENLERFKQVNDVRPQIMDIIYKSLEK